MGCRQELQLALKYARKNACSIQFTSSRTYHHTLTTQNPLHRVYRSFGVLGVPGGGGTSRLPRLKPQAVRPPAASRAFVCSLRLFSTHTPISATSSTTHHPHDSQEPGGTPPPRPPNTTDNSAPSTEAITVSVSHGLPQLTIPLPSRKELCRFTLRPVTQTVQDLIAQLQHEDRGIDRVNVTTTAGVRIASSASIESLLTEDFIVIINDIAYTVTLPSHHRITMEELSDMGDVRQLVNKLYAALNIDQHQVEKEREILAHIEDVKTKLAPLDKKRSMLVSGAERRTSVLAWTGLGYMALQFGFLARLTWWEYSWDIMEPVTYFVTYGTAIVAYAYYVLTRQDFILPEVRDRQFLLSFHRRAYKVGLNVQEYNSLKERLSRLEGDLSRLQDPLALNLPPAKLEYDPECHDALTKAQLSIKSFFRFKT